MEGRSTIANLDEPSKRCVLIALMHFLKTDITIDGHSFNTNTHAVRISEWRHLSILSHLPHGFTALQMEKDKALTVAGRRPGRCSRARRPRQKKRGTLKVLR